VANYHSSAFSTSRGSGFGEFDYKMKQRIETPGTRKLGESVYQYGASDARMM